MKKSKKITICAILVALSVVLLYLASIFPILSLSLIATAGLLPAVAVTECGVSYAAIMYVASSILTVLLAPDKSCAIMYVILFGDYPFIKYYAERVRSRILAWVLKLAAANVLLVILFALFKSVILAFVPSDMVIAAVFIFFNIIFVMYDLCFTKLTGFYMARIHRHII